MKAIILNSGTGSRMGSQTTLRPKCLAEIAKRQDGQVDTIVSAQLDALCSLGIDEIVMTTGFGDQILRRYIADRFPDLLVEYVKNPVYRDTNYIYSLHLACRRMDDAVLLLHGDMVFEVAAIEYLLRDPAANGVMVNRKAPLPEKDFKARIAGGCVSEIGIEPNSADCCSLSPIYKLSPALYAAWSAEIAGFVARGETGVYAEDALNNVLGRDDSPHVLAPVNFEGLCMEVDTVADLIRARRLYDACVLQEESSRRRTSATVTAHRNATSTGGGLR